uniref:Uncharacterized protein n=1 Tax=Parascaris equorum TaxID=6256 RepID=A0A914S6N1_PAREQ
MKLQGRLNQSLRKWKVTESTFFESTAIEIGNKGYIELLALRAWIKPPQLLDCRRVAKRDNITTNGTKTSRELARFIKPCEKLWSERQKRIRDIPGTEILHAKIWPNRGLQVCLRSSFLRMRVGKRRLVFTSFIASANAAFQEVLIDFSLLFYCIYRPKAEFGIRGLIHRNILFLGTVGSGVSPAESSESVRCIEEKL